MTSLKRDILVDTVVENGVVWVVQIQYSKTRIPSRPSFCACVGSLVFGYIDLFGFLSLMDASPNDTSTTSHPNPSN